MIRKLIVFLVMLSMQQIMAGDWVLLFNGKDLNNWKIRDGCWILCIG